MTGAGADAFTELLKRVIGKSANASPKNAVLLACVCVPLAVTTSVALRDVDHVHYLPLFGAVMATALVGSRTATLFVIGVSIAADLAMKGRSDLFDAAVGTGLFIAVSLLLAEVGHRLTSRTALLHSILTSVPVVTLDDEGRIRRITGPAADLLGVAPEDAHERPFSLFAPDFGEDILASFVKDAPLAAPPSGYWLVRRPNGEIVPVIIHGGLLAHSMASERVVLSLADQRPSLAVNDRMRDLMDQLSKSWRLNSMGEMAAILAHELNQPLTAATVYLHACQTDIARAGPIGDSAGRALDLAKTQLLRAGDIIRRMRELIATGASQLTEERVSSMVDDLRPLFDLIRQETGIAVRIDVDTTGDRVLADRIQFQQAITNLVRNAVDAVGDHPGAVVSLTGRSLADEGYEIRIEDNGPGIAEDQMDRIFQPMMTTKAGGMGLGLSVTRSIIESHDAALAVGRSALGGAAFSFRLTPVTELEAA